MLSTDSGVDSRPASERLADELRRALEAGDIAPGDRLPSERALAERHGMARNAARQAIRLPAEGGLEERGHTMAPILDEINARMPTPEERQHLRISPSIPVLDVLHTSTDTDGEPYELTRFVMRADLSGLRYDTALNNCGRHRPDRPALGSGFFWIKLSLDGFTPAQLTFLRPALGAFVLVPIVFVRRLVSHH